MLLTVYCSQHAAKSCGEDDKQEGSNNFNPMKGKSKGSPGMDVDGEKIRCKE